MNNSMEKQFIRYERVKCIGEGQFAIVYKAKDTTNNRIVAVKKIKYCQKENRNELISEVIASEIKILNSLKHENIIELLDVMEDRFNISLVFDHMESDLEKIIKNTRIIIAPENVKAILKMILQGLEYLHSKQIMHRDLKPNNLLINANGIVKIADFGLAKYYGSPKKVHTHQVATRWYRAPELLFGSRHYDTSIDIWSVGCVLAELLLRTPFLPGTSDLDQLTKIFEVFGTPTPDTWPGIQHLPHYVNFGNCTPLPIGNVFQTASSDLLELASRLFTLYPNQRCTAVEAINMPYFTNEPQPLNLNTIPKLSLSAKRGRSVKRRRLDKEMDGGTVPKKLFF